MRAAIDADILQYEISFAAEAYWKYKHLEKGDEVVGPPPFDVVLEMLEGRIEEIVEASGAIGEPLLFFTGKNNYRNHIATTQEYKLRNAARPFHYKNVKAYLQAMYEWVQKDWFEADDLIKLWMIRNPGEYICVTRDKDLHQIPGRHYGWELGKQPSFGPLDIDTLGFVKMNTKKKIIGGGEKYFYCQMLLGDTTDNIPGIKGMGDVTTFALLSPLESVEALQATVFGVYLKKYGEGAMSRFIETGNLLRMSEDADEDYTKVKLWNPFLEEPEWMDVRTGVKFVNA